MLFDITDKQAESVTTWEDLAAGTHISVTVKPDNTNGMAGLIYREHAISLGQLSSDKMFQLGLASYNVLSSDNLMYWVVRMERVGKDEAVFRVVPLMDFSSGC